MPRRHTWDGGPVMLGSELPPALQREALACYVHRFTGTHRPQWANQPRPDGTPYPVQFKDDSDWLAHTRFCVVTRGGKLALASADCESTPTWPDNPELRKGAGNAA